MATAMLRPPGGQAASDFLQERFGIQWGPDVLGITEDGFTAESVGVSDGMFTVTLVGRCTREDVEKFVSLLWSKAPRSGVAVEVEAALAVPVVGDDHQECMTLEEHASLCGQIERLTEQLERVGDDTTETDREALADFIFRPLTIDGNPWLEGQHGYKKRKEAEEIADALLAEFTVSSRATRPEGQNQ